MKLYEYQAKEIFKKYDIPVPQGELANSSDEVARIAKDINKKVAIKSQVLAGARGKAGGIALADDAQSAKIKSLQIFGKIIKNIEVKKVLVEECAKYVKEFYLAITVDRSSGENILMFTTEGGIEIEELARNNPEAIIRYPISLNNIEGMLASYGLTEIVKKLAEIYFNLDCELAEINPLVLTEDNKYIALDAKIIIDENALFRHPEFLSFKEDTETDPIESEAHRKKIAYVRIEGDVGIIGNGAGLVMATMDVVRRAGGLPANFLDIGGGAKKDKVINALRLLMMDTNIKGIFVNIFGGITRCDEVAEGLMSAFIEEKINLPVVIRLEGTRCEEARKLLCDSTFHYVTSMEEGAKKIVELVEKLNIKNKISK